MHLPAALHRTPPRLLRRAARPAIALAAVLALAGGACRSTPNGDRLTAAAAADRPRGTLFIVGGGPRPEAMTRQFVELAGGAGKARILVLAMASRVPDAGDSEVEALRRLGADARNVRIARADAAADSVVRLFDGATGIWFGGGDQNRITAAIEGTPVEEAIRARYRAGAVVGGTSAGAAVISDPMLTGDERRLGGDRPPRDSSEAYLTIARDNIVLAPALGLIDGAIVDQHFLRRKRHNRLMSVVLERPNMIGAGIDESTALLVGPDGRWRVIGASSVVVYDARRARVTGPGAPVLGAADVRLHVLPPGSSYDPATGRVELP